MTANEMLEVIEKYKIEIWFMNKWRAAVKHRVEKQMPNGFMVETDAYKFTEGITPLEAVENCLKAMND